MNNTKLVIHECCGPCSVYPVKLLQDKGMLLHAYLYNPNIHPYTEYKKRLETAVEFNIGAGLSYTVEDLYGLDDFLLMKANSTYRCGGCYEMRLEKLALFASGNGFEAITTTLLYSIYQNHDYILSKGKQIAQRHGLDFWYEDFRKGWQVGVDLSKEMNMYRQKYCGCIFSEQERYLKNKRASKSESR